MKKIKSKYIFILIFFILMVSGVILYYNSHAKELRNGIENFPESYKGYLEELSRKHPNWNFTALYTGLDWNYVITEEDKFGRNLVPKNYSDSWKNTNPRRI